MPKTSLNLWDLLSLEKQVSNTSFGTDALRSATGITVFTLNVSGLEEKISRKEKKGCSSGSWQYISSVLNYLSHVFSLGENKTKNK